MAQLPLSTSMATYSPWWSASTCGRMSRSYISSPKRAVSSRGRRVGMVVSLPWAGTVVLSASFMRPPSRRASVHGALYHLRACATTKEGPHRGGQGSAIIYTIRLPKDNRQVGRRDRQALASQVLDNSKVNADWPDSQIDATLARRRSEQGEQLHRRTRSAAQRALCVAPAGPDRVGRSRFGGALGPGGSQQPC